MRNPLELCESGRGVSSTLDRTNGDAVRLPAERDVGAYNAHLGQHVAFHSLHRARPRSIPELAAMGGRVLYISFVNSSTYAPELIEVTLR